MRVVPIQRPRRLACQPDRPPTSDSGSDSDVETERIPRARQPREPDRQPPQRNRRTNEQNENDRFLPETDHPQPVNNDNYSENANKNGTDQQPETEGEFQNATSNRLNNENLFILLQQQQLQLQQQQEQQQQMTLLLEAALDRPSTTNQAFIKSTHERNIFLS